MQHLRRNLSEPAPVPEEGIRRAVEVMRSGWLTRYGEYQGEGSEVAALEREFARYMGARYALAVNSCGAALFIALLCAGVRPGARVLVNAFTLAPVPGAVAHAGAEPIYVECDGRHLKALCSSLANRPCSRISMRMTNMTIQAITCSIENCSK